MVPPHNRESGFYSRYFIVPKKGGGLHPILDLRLVNRSVMRLKFKMLTIKQVVSQIRSEDCFVTIDLKHARFHISILPQHRKFLRFAFRGKAYQYRFLPFGLALSPHTFTKCMDGSLVTPRHPHTKLHRRLVDSSSISAVSSSTSRCRSHSLERLGVKAQRKEKCASSSTEDHLSGRGVGFDHDAGTSLSCSYRVNRRDSQESERRPVTHCEAFSKAVGSDGSCVKRDNFWPAAHETLAVVAQDHRDFPEGNPFHVIKVTRQC